MSSHRLFLARVTPLVLLLLLAVSSAIWVIDRRWRGNFADLLLQANQLDLVGQIDRLAILATMSPATVATCTSCAY